MIDVDHHVNAIRREVGSTVLEAGEARVVRMTRTYATTADDLWDACTSVERIPRWFLPISGELRVGGRYQLEGNAGGVIEVCEPPRRFTATWEMGEQLSWIDVRVEPDGDRARLVLEHLAPVTAEAEEFWDQFGPGAVGVGWDLAVTGLALYVEAEGEFDKDAVQAWSESDDGRRFMAVSSDGWRVASIAFGTDEAAATAAAERTTAFYTVDPTAN
jgi:uncharacterized protein YndB with AHSA1/START domain